MDPPCAKVFAAGKNACTAQAPPRLAGPRCAQRELLVSSPGHSSLAGRLRHRLGHRRASPTGQAPWGPHFHPTRAEWIRPAPRFLPQAKTLVRRKRRPALRGPGVPRGSYSSQARATPVLRAASATALATAGHPPRVRPRGAPIFILLGRNGSALRQGFCRRQKCLYGASAAPPCGAPVCPDRAARLKPGPLRWLWPPPPPPWPPPGTPGGQKRLGRCSPGTGHPPPGRPAPGRRPASSPR